MNFNSGADSGDDDGTGETAKKTTSMMSHNNTSIMLDAELVSQIQAFCQSKRILMFSFVLSVLHHSMRAYSHEAFAVMFVNTVLVPFAGGKEGGMEMVQALNQRWTRDILPHSTTPYDVVLGLGYGCNAYLAFNIGIFDRMKTLNNMNDDGRDISWEQEYSKTNSEMTVSN